MDKEYTINVLLPRMRNAVANYETLAKRALYRADDQSTHDKYMRAADEVRAAIRDIEAKS